MRYKEFLDSLGLEDNIIMVHCDSQIAVHFTKHQVFHEISKHIDVKLRFTREVTEV